MPRFFFRISDGETYEDNEGQELPDLEAARGAAVQAARELIAEGARDGHIPIDDKIDVLDEAREVVATVTFRETVRLDGSGPEPRQAAT